MAGLVLAGGRSSRFGGEKALALWDGRPLIARAAAVLRGGCAVLAVSAPKASGAAAWAVAEGLAVLEDAPGLPRHPLAGVLAGLLWARGLGAAGLVTVPCDAPALPADLVARLRAAGPAAYATSPAGPEPLCALWPVAAAEALERLILEEPPMRQALRALNAQPALFDDAAAFANINRRSDLQGP